VLLSVPPSYTSLFLSMPFLKKRSDTTRSSECQSTEVSGTELLYAGNALQHLMAFGVSKEGGIVQAI